MRYGHLAALHASVCAASCATSRSAAVEDDPPHVVELPRPTLTYLRTEVRQYGSDDNPYFREMAILTLRNDTPWSFEYRGQDFDWPDGTTEVWQGGRWEMQRLSVCGNGWGPYAIEPGASVDLVVHGFAGLCRYGMRMRNVALDQWVDVMSDPFEAP